MDQSAAASRDKRRPRHRAGNHKKDTRQRYMPRKNRGAAEECSAAVDETKVVVRWLPFSLEEREFLEQIEPFGKFVKWHRFVSDAVLGNRGFVRPPRAYLTFSEPEQLPEFAKFVASVDWEKVSREAEERKNKEKLEERRRLEMEHAAREHQDQDAIMVEIPRQQQPLGLGSRVSGAARIPSALKRQVHVEFAPFSKVPGPPRLVSKEQGTIEQTEDWMQFKEVFEKEGILAASKMKPKNMEQVRVKGQQEIPAIVSYIVNLSLAPQKKPSKRKSQVKKKKKPQKDQVKPGKGSGKSSKAKDSQKKNAKA